LSLQNGVDNVERIREATGIEAIPAVVYVGVEMTAPGKIQHTGRGDLVVGDAERALLDRIAALFSRSGVPCRVSDNVRGELWRKLVINCAYNAISALGHAHYGAIAAEPAARALMSDVVDETIAVARAAGIVLPDGDLHAEVAKLGTMMPRATSSTAQDIARGRRTEIDALNGHVARLGGKLGVPTPVNRTLATLVLLLQESRTPTARTP
jgi:2-dehydropantoate 2-reductase